MGSALSEPSIVLIVVAFISVCISIVEKAGEEGQEKELKLKTVTYHTEGDLDTGFDAHLSGGYCTAQLTAVYCTVQHVGVYCTVQHTAVYCTAQHTCVLYSTAHRCVLYSTAHRCALYSTARTCVLYSTAHRCIVQHSTQMCIVQHSSQVCIVQHSGYHWGRPGHTGRLQYLCLRCVFDITVSCVLKLGTGVWRDCQSL